ncbi:MAG: processing protein [Candidatus Parcubacteria bacterium]|nr:processing protein [Candidatus Parcubacteria bacterium]
MEMADILTTVRLKPDDYPLTLRQLTRPPPHLYCAGALPPPSDEYRYLSVVGARKYSSYGKEACQKLIEGLRGQPIVIVSGLAIGIDSIAHEAALKSELMTIAFPGSGLSASAIYPHSHLRLAERIARSGGALLSPFEPEQGGAPWTFPIRNVLMAGISHAVLLIEGRRHSGTLQTASAALEFGRDVMIVPGSIFSDLSFGPHSLYRDGATPVHSSEDILETLGFDVERESGAAFTRDLERIKRSLSPPAQQILSLLETGPLAAADIIGRIRIAPAQFNVLISELELEGMIIENDGVYRLNNFAF